MKKWNNKIFMTLGNLFYNYPSNEQIPLYQTPFNQSVFVDYGLGEHLEDLITFNGAISGETSVYASRFKNLFAISGGVFILRDYVLELFDAIGVEYENEIVATLDASKDMANINNEAYYNYYRVLANLCNLANLTYEKYSTLLGFYASKKADLMNALSSSYSDVGASSSKSENFNLSNDTPQEVYDDDYSDNNYASSTSKGKSESSMRTNLNHSELHEGDTLIARLKEIEDKYSNVMQEWIKEFDKFFTSNLNVADYEEYMGV